MGEQPRTIELGSATITIFNVGELAFDVGASLNVTRDEWYPIYGSVLENASPVALQCILVQLPGTTVLVDAGEVDWPIAATPGESPNATTNLLKQLAAAGIDAATIDHVVVTHAHGDHYNSATVLRDGKYTPSFPRARYYLGRADWQRPEVQKNLQDPESMDSSTLGVLNREGRLELIDAEQSLAPGVQIIPTPGETPGHLILRIQENGQTLYCLGDLYHHVVEVEHPAWAVTWADLETIQASRQSLVAKALPEQALLVATHILGAGRLAQTDTGVRWIVV